MKPRGKPFSCGTDSRRHLSGTKDKRALSFKAEMARLIEGTDPTKIYKVLKEKAEAGVQWACQELLDRGLGRPVQQIEEKRDARVQLVFPEPNGGPLLTGAGSVAALPPASTSTLCEPVDAEVIEDGGKDITDAELRDLCKKAVG